MAQGQLNALLEFIRALGRAAPDAENSDSRLLQRYFTLRDEAAFAGLLHRHGPMVLSVCRRVLGDGPDAEDAFQATFLVLVRKAGSIRRQGSVASWLYGVAARVARQARISAARRQAHEMQAPAKPASQEHDRVEWSDLRALLDEELDRLPEKYRAPLVLCYLEGRTREQAAEQLGWPNGTVCGRLARGRDLLRGRLVRRGVTLSAAALAALAAEATAAVPASLFSSIITTAAQFAAGNSEAGGAASASVVTLAEGALKAMYLTKLRTTAAIILTLGLLGTAGVTLAHHASAGGSPRNAGVEPDALPAVEPQQAAKSPPQQQSDRDSAGKAKVSPKGAEGGSVSQSVGFGCDGGASFGFARGGAIAGPGFAAGAAAGPGGAAAGAVAGGGFGGFGAGGAISSCRLALLSKETVQRELKLTREQLKKLKDTQAKQQQNLLGLMRQAPGNFFQDPDTIRKKFEELHDDAEKGVDDVLTQAQVKRLREISLQQRGGHALSDSDVAEILKLTEGQREQIESIRTEAAKELQTLAMKEMQGIMRLEGNPFDFQKAFEKMDKGQKTFDKLTKKSEELSKSTSKKLLDVLNTEQKDTWKKLLGKPFSSKGS